MHGKRCKHYMRQGKKAKDKTIKRLKNNSIIPDYQSRVNFNNMAANKMDLRQDVAFQGWGKFFERLNGPIYEKIVKEFRKHATCDDNYIVSHVLGKKFVITEKLIARLLELNHREGKVIAGKDKEMSDKESIDLNSYLYKDYMKDVFTYP